MQFSIGRAIHDITYYALQYADRFYVQNYQNYKVIQGELIITIAYFMQKVKHFHVKCPYISKLICINTH